ncbi:MAG: hypothetical protein JNG84_06665, partial [Archangium sp.]|nr:hypothetical protein [Archangium sp.]
MAWTAEAPRAVLPRGILEQTLTRISDSGPWGPLLSELFFVAVVTTVAALMWWLSGIAAIRVLARRLGAPVESLKPLGTGLHVAVVLSAVGT